VRYWTVEEAREYLPRLRFLVEVVARAAGITKHASGNGHGPAAAPDAPGTQDDAAAGDGDAGRDPSKPASLDATSALTELHDGGIVVRDPVRGLVDFPARHPGGRDVLLCWQLGEDDLAWWHLPEDGFAGRRPLPLPPEL